MCVCSESPFLGTQPSLARFYYVLSVHLLAPSDPLNTSITRHRLRSGSCTRFFCVPCRLLYNTVLAGAPKTFTDRFQRVLNAAARVVSGTRKFDRGLSQLLHPELHWLDIPQRVQYKLGVTVHRYLQNKAPQYPRTSDVSSRQRLRSANRRQLMIPRHRRSTFGRLAFSVAGPMEWNSLPDSLRDHARRTDLQIGSENSLFWGE